MIDFHSQLPIIPEVYETAELQDNLEHSGGITITWKSATDVEIPLGSYITYGGMRYQLMQPYAPSKESKVHYKYSPTFKHPQAMLDFKPFWIKSKDADNNDIYLRTTSYTGFPYVIAQKLCDFFAEYVAVMHDTYFAETVGTDWTYHISAAVDEHGREINQYTIITVAFDGCSIKSAADSIAEAMGCNVFFDWSTKTIRFVAGTTIQGETYNCFHVLGGTTNMGKNTASGSFAAITQRLTLRTEADETHTQEGVDYFPGSIIKTGAALEQGGLMLIKDLILDDIYPKMELYVCYTHQRLCNLTDNDTGEFIVDHWEKDGHVVPADTPGAEPVLKHFAKWYVRLSLDPEGLVPYKFDQSKLINDKPLSMLFQMDYRDPEHMSKLVGREFELTYFPSAVKEWDKTDTVNSDNAYVTYTGTTPETISEFRIAIVAEGETILPTTSTIVDGQQFGLIPQIGDKVTLVNMALTEEKGRAQDELLAAAQEIIGLMQTPSGEYSETVIFGDEDSETHQVPAPRMARLMVGDASPFGEAHGPIVTSIQHNLDTDVAEVTVGSWTRKTRTGGTADKLETVTVSANSSTEGGTPYSSGSIGEGGGYSGYGGNSVDTYGQTNPKPESMFFAGLTNSIDAVGCDSAGKVKVTTDVYTKITAYAGIKEVTASCIVSVPFGKMPPVDTTESSHYKYIKLYVTDRNGDETLIDEDEKGFELTDSKCWLRFNFEKNYDMSLLNDTLTQLFEIEHPAYLERELTMVVQAQREGGIGESPAQLFTQVSSSTTTVSAPVCSAANYMAGTNLPQGWSKYAQNHLEDYDVYMSQNTIISDGNGGYTLKNELWSTPVRITGDKGDAGEDAKEREWIYRQDVSTGYLNTTGTIGGDPSKPISGKTGGIDNCLLVDDFVPNNWSDNAIAVSDTHDTVYASWRDYDKTNERWGVFNTPIIWSHWGTNGIDGDGVQYIYKLFNHELTDDTEEGGVVTPGERTTNIPTNATFDNTTKEWMPSSDDPTSVNYGWSDNPLAPTSSMPFCYCSIIKKINGSWNEDAQHHGIFEKLGLWSKWAADGENGADMGENLIDKSQGPHTFNVNAQTGTKYFNTVMRYDPTRIVAGTYSGQMVVTLSGCSVTANSKVRLITNTSGDTNRIVDDYNVSANGTYQIKTPNLTLDPKQQTLNGIVILALENFGSGGTVTIEHVKLETGARCSGWSLSENDKIGPEGPAGQDGQNGQNGQNGQDGHAYTLKTTPSQLLYNPNTTNYVNTSAFTATKYDNGEALESGTLKLYAVPTSGSRTELVPTSTTDTSATFNDSNKLYVGYARFEAELTIDGVVAASSSIPIVRFGENGTNGSTGHVGRWYYYAGVYDNTPSHYTMEATQAPYVMVVSGNTKSFWMLDFHGAGTDGSHAQDAPGPNSQSWTQMQSEHEYYIAKAYFGDSAYLGSFIINGDWMISQQGTNNSSNPQNPDYLDFTPITSGTGAGTFDKTRFVPHFAVNGSNGKVYMNDAYVRGQIEADSGHIGGFKINQNTITDDSNSPTFFLDSNNKKMIVGNVEVRSQQNFLSDGEPNYDWSGLASKSGYDNVTALGTRHFTSSEENGGHLRLNSSNGGVFDVLTGGNTPQSLLRMGIGMNNLRVLINGGLENDTQDANLASIEVKTTNRSGDDAKSTVIKPNGITTPRILVSDSIRINPSRIYSLSAASEDEPLRGYYHMIIFTGNDGTIRLASTVENGTLTIIKKTTESGWLIVQNGNGGQIGKINNGTIMCVYDNGWK